MSLSTDVYCHPRQPEFTRPFFKSKLRVFKRRLHIEDNRATLDGNATLMARAPWMVRPHPNQHSVKDWEIKLYICSTARSYFRNIDRLVDISSGDPKFPDWKFYAGKDYARPDKIVLYFDSARGLRRYGRLLSEQLRGGASIQLAHTRPASAFGIDGRGFFVGADPLFIGRSWRVYSCLCRAYASKNTEYFDDAYGSTRLFLKKMNIDISTGGPISLSFGRVDKRFIKKTWKSMFG